MARKYSKKQLEIAVTSCLKNAESLVDDAQTLFEKGSYGHAVTLSILAREEAIKGLILLEARVGLAELTHNAMRILHQHKAKHLLEKGYLHLSDILDPITKAIIAQNAKSNLKRALEEAMAMVNPVTTAKTLESQMITEIKPKSENLDSLKERGLYVDFDKRSVISPTDIKKEEAFGQIGEARKLVEELKSPMLGTMEPANLALLEEAAEKWKGLVKQSRQDK